VYTLRLAEVSYLYCISNLVHRMAPDDGQDCQWCVPGVPQDVSCPVKPSIKCTNSSATTLSRSHIDIAPETTNIIKQTMIWRLFAYIKRKMVGSLAFLGYMVKKLWKNTFSKWKIVKQELYLSSFFEKKSEKMSFRKANWIGRHRKWKGNLIKWH